MKITALAPSNIAFIKFFGKKDEIFRLPVNSSISMCLSEAVTKTTVEFSQALKKDDISIIGGHFSTKEKNRIINHLDRIRKLAKSKSFCRVVTKNLFPKSAGIASSASGFAALTLAGVRAAGLKLSGQELSILARLASGSACRSIPDGFVEWQEGDRSENSYAYSLYPANYWDICDIIAVVDKGEKKIPTSDAHRIASSSPFFKTRIEKIAEKIAGIKKAIVCKDFTAFGEITEKEAINMHAVMLTATPPLLYISGETIKVIESVWSWREKKLPVYFTLDAGANVHLICEGKNKMAVIDGLKKIRQVKQIIVNKPAEGARLVNDHLF